VLSLEMLRTLLAGFSHNLKSGVSLLYATSDGTSLTVQDSNRTDPVEPASEAAAGFYNPVCSRYRREGGEALCRACDLAKAREIVTGKPVKVRTITPELYECHLGFDDQVYPIYLGNVCYGVIFAGQLIPDETKRRSRTRAALTATSIGLGAAFDSAASTGNWSTSKQIEQKRHSLVEFGRLLQAILDEIYESRTKAATETYIQQVGEALAKADLSDASIWWKQIIPILEDFKSLMALADLRVFLRYTTYFKQEYPLQAKECPSAQRIPTRDIVMAIKPGELVPAAQDAAMRQLESQLGVASDGVQFHLTSTKAGDRHLSTLVVLKGEIPIQYSDVPNRFCSTLGLRIEIASLVFALREAHRTYLQSVADTAHDVKTPLQALILRAESLANTPGIAHSAEAERAEEVIWRVFEIVPLLDALAKTRPLKGDTNIGDLVKQAVETVRPLADKHPCGLEFTYLGEVLEVRADQNQIRRALQNILDNAIKYSWHGPERVVRVSISLHEGRYVRVRTVNYGIGVPEAFLNDFSERGRRALVLDEGYPRTGTGTGLPSAFDIVKDHGGWIEMQSKPAGAGVRKPGEEYHRYLTTVDVFLPII
jgi:signal transduction histidine kinase